VARSDPTGNPGRIITTFLHRASCRNFSRKKIPARLLNLILEAGCRAPTGGNLQPYSIVKIENERTKAELAGLLGQEFIGRAPVNLLFCIDWHRLERWARQGKAPFTATASFRHFWISFQDTVICAQNICAAADALGLGSVYVGTVLEIFPRLKKMFRLPRGVFPVVLLCLGYPRGNLVPRGKLGPDLIVHAGRYRDPGGRKLRRAFEKKYPNYRIEVTDERLQTVYRAAGKAHGAKFARECIARIKKQGYINAVQRYFGLHYRADRMPVGNEKYLKLFRDFGFKWFDKFQPGKGKK
jgi:FMN reductase [NAD(P)H]